MITGAPSLCRACGGDRVQIFYETPGIPVQSVLLFPSRSEALGMPRGDLRLGFCPSCGFIGNQAFDPTLLEYSSRYEETQGFSPTFVRFHTDLAARLIERFDLRGKKILEIGCGKGEFLTLLCELGNNHGIGFDPAYDETRTVSPAKDRMQFVKEFYSERFADVRADLVCCKMTLEHIATPLEFLRTIRRALGEHRDTKVFFQVPETMRVLREGAFWDLYYEHCSYFAAVSLEGVFRRAGFGVRKVWTEYDDQYLMIDAYPGTPDTGRTAEDAAAIGVAQTTIDQFSRDVVAGNAEWSAFVRSRARLGQRMVIWGAGSKGVGFLTSLNLQDEILYAVDVNPHKYGTFLAGTGQEIVSPDFLRTYRPDIVFVMNPIYRDEIAATLRGLGVAAELILLGA
jgi:SAM-dependent methyltransferase